MRETPKRLPHTVGSASLESAVSSLRGIRAEPQSSTFFCGIVSPGNASVVSIFDYFRLQK